MSKLMAQNSLCIIMMKNMMNISLFNIENILIKEKICITCNLKLDEQSILFSIVVQNNIILG